MVTSPSNSVCPRCGQTVSSGWIGGLCPRCISRTSLGALLGPTPAARPRLGDYELGEELGRGAMGAVYRARHVPLGQTVALKVILTGEFASESERRRFLAEAGQAARLDHPNIVRVLNYGEADGRQFYAMELVEGPTLAQRRQNAGDLAGNGAPSEADPRSFRHFASLISQVARAVQHAHERGVLHRDLKPGNILLDAAGTPHVADFGLATLLGGDGESQSVRATLAGSPLGTPAYMAPEQVRGDRTLTTASDLWSLGAILYEQLAGRPPFTGGSAPETYRKILEEEPPRLGEGQLGAAANTPSPVRDLEIIARKCLRKVPAERYPSAGALADDLDRWLRGEPILARPVSAPEQAWRWARRRPVIAALTAAVASLVLLVAIGGPVVAFRLSRAERRERAANVTAQEKLFDSLLAQARASRLTLEPGRREAGLQAIRSAAKIRVTAELRDEAIALLALSDQAAPVGFTNLIFRGLGATLDPQFGEFLWMEADRSVAIRRREDGQEVFRWPAPDTNAVLSRAAFSPDGTAVALNFRSLQLLVVGRADRQGRLDVTNAWFGGFSPDGSRIAVVTGGRRLQVHASATGKRLAEHRFEGEVRADLAFHPGGAPVLAVPVGGQLQLWHWENDAVLETFAEETPVLCTAWRGDLLASSMENGQVRLLNLRTRQRQLLPGHRAAVDRIQFSPDASLLASHFGYDGLAHWWDTHTGALLLRSERQHFHQFSRDGTQVAWEDTVRWGTTRVVRPRSYRAGFASGHHPHSFSPDGRWLLAGGPEGLEIRDTATGDRLLFQPMDDCIAAYLLPGGRELITADRRQLKQWSVRAESGRLRLADERPLCRWTERLEAVALNPAGTRLALAGGDRLELLDLAKPDEPRVLADASVPRSPTFSADGRWLVTGTFHGRGLQVWDLTTGKAGPLLNTGNVFTRFSPDGRQLLAATSEGLLIFETGTWKVLFKLPGESASSLPGLAAWSANGRLLAFVRRQTELVLLDSESWTNVAKLVSPAPLRLHGLAFHPGGGQLVASGERRLETWDLASLRAELGDLGLPWSGPAAGVAVAPTPREFAELTPPPDEPALPRGMRPRQQFPPRPAAATAAQLDLSRHYNARLDEDWHFTGGAGNSLGTVPTEFVDPSGVKFDARGILQLASASLAAQRTGYPLAATRLPVGQHCRALHFLGACGYAGSESPGAQVGRYVVHYADGTESEVPIRHGQDTGDWWRPPQPQPGTTAATVAWEGLTPEGRPVHLFRQTWQNPKPDVRIDHLDFVSAKRSSAPFLVAITAE
jgi:serine/threonine protein kinase/WD40 repeat protein